MKLCLLSSEGSTVHLLTYISSVLMKRDIPLLEVEIFVAQFDDDFSMGKYKKHLYPNQEACAYVCIMR